MSITPPPQPNKNHTIKNKRNIVVSSYETLGVGYNLDSIYYKLKNTKITK